MKTAFGTKHLIAARPFAIGRIKGLHGPFVLRLARAAIFIRPIFVRPIFVRPTIVSGRTDIIHIHTDCTAYRLHRKASKPGERGRTVEKPGVVFTKKWVVDFMLDIVGYTDDKDLCRGCVVEPSCGKGAFLARIVSRLCKSAQLHQSLSPRHLLNCVRAYDIDERAVQASRNTVCSILLDWGLSQEESRELAERWIVHGDYLLDETPQADWIVGNPPYIRASMLPRDLRAKYMQRFTCTTMGSDLYIAFIEKSLGSLADSGLLCFICSDRWLQNRYGSKLRAFIAADYSISAHIRMHHVDAFDSTVSAYPAISLMTRGDGKPMRYVECSNAFSQQDARSVKEWLRGEADASDVANAQCSVIDGLSGTDCVPLAAPRTLEIIDQMSKRYPTLEDAGIKLGIGVASGCDSVYITDDPNLVEQDRLLPLFYMRDWRAGRRDALKFLVNPWESAECLVDLDSYPLLKNYLMNNQERLKSRRVAKDHPDEWYRTLDKPNLSLMGKEMLLFPDMSMKPDPVYSDGSRYPHHNCYWMTSNEWDIKALGGIMMSDLVESYISAFGVKMRGSTLRFQAQYLRLIHIPRASDLNQDIIDELAIAFTTGDRARANIASRRAYGLEGL